MSRKLLQFSSILAGVAFVAVFYGLAISNTPKSEAISAMDFNAGNIIDDAVFYDANTMSVADIQNHLNRYMPACDTWGTGAVGSGRSINGRSIPSWTSRAEYARQKREAGDSRYHEPPYVCVQNYYENPSTHENLYDTHNEIRPGMISAAQIIYNVAHDFNVNPQVLLVMLKKESYVWGDNWPLRYEYNTVMGYACPDTAPCNSKYFGFYNQMHMAAWQLNYYKSHIYSYNYRPYAVNNILYSPDASCGRKSVYLENIATTSLYIYTPYTPNDAALRAYPGTATCGSYGNRNFFMYFNEWFGDTHAKEGEKRIEERQQYLDDAGKSLGKKLTDRANCNIGHAGACVQAYENGVIVYSPSTGAWENYGEIRKRFITLGSVDGALGFPSGPVNCSIGHDGACVQAYQNGVIISSTKTGTWENYGEIRKKFVSLGSVDGDLGFPTGPMNTSAYFETVLYQKFQGGILYYDSSNGSVWARYDLR